MIDLYYWPTPNGHKVSILLEELGLPYEVHPVNIGAGEQFDPAFLKISPNNKMPAIVDRQAMDGKPYAVFESGAILMYLCDKTGSSLLPHYHPRRYDTLQWLMFQMGGLGPMLGQAHHFRQYAPESIEYAVTRYTREAGRLYRVMDTRLGEAPFLAGADYTIADIACFPWVRSIEKQGHTLDDHPNVKRWFELIGSRPAVQRGVALLAERRTDLATDAQAREAMFGARQYAKH